MEPMTSASAALEVLLALAAHTQGATVEELAAAAGVREDDALSALELLAQHELAEEDPVFAFRFRLADGAALQGDAGRNVRLRVAAWPYLQRIHAATGRTAGLATVENGCHRFIDECPHRPQSVLRELPLLRYAEPAVLRTGSTAKAILAFLPPAVAERILEENGRQLDASNTAFTDLDAWRRAAPTRHELATIRAQGYAYSSGERSASQRGVLSMTAPVLDWTGTARGALWLAGTPAEEREEAAAILTAAAQELSADLGHIRS